MTTEWVQIKRFEISSLDLFHWYNRCNEISFTTFFACPTYRFTLYCTGIFIFSLLTHPPITISSIHWNHSPCFDCLFFELTLFFLSQLSFNREFNPFLFTPTSLFIVWSFLLAFYCPLKQHSITWGPSSFSHLLHHEEDILQGNTPMSSSFLYTHTKDKNVDGDE